MCTVEPLITLTWVTVTGAVSPTMFRPTAKERFWAAAVVPTPPGLALTVAGPAVATTTVGVFCNTPAATTITATTITTAATSHAASPRDVCAPGSFDLVFRQPDRANIPVPVPISRAPYRMRPNPSC